MNALRVFSGFLLAACASGGAGCEPPPKAASVNPPPLPLADAFASSSSAPVQPLTSEPNAPTSQPGLGTSSATETPRDSEPTATSAQQSSSPASSPPATAVASTPTVAAPAVQLRTGVALPQSTPDGTLVFFSVEYRFTIGGPATSSRYFAVAETAVGEFRMPCNLETQGTLQGICPAQVRPEHVPFRLRLEELASGASQPVRVAVTIEMR